MRLRRQIEVELSDQELLVGIQLRVAAEDQGAAIGGGEMHVAARACGNHAASLSRYPAVAASSAGRKRLTVRGPNLPIEAPTFHAGNRAFSGPCHMRFDM
jgi:hypothetical protein